MDQKSGAVSGFEYVCVRLLGAARSDGDRRWTEQINQVAAHGWRLVAVDAGMATFERPRS